MLPGLTSPLVKIYLLAPKYVPRPKFDVSSPNVVHQADRLFLLHSHALQHLQIFGGQLLFESITPFPPTSPVCQTLELTCGWVENCHAVAVLFSHQTLVATLPCNFETLPIACVHFYRRHLHKRVPDLLLIPAYLTEEILHRVLPSIESLPCWRFSFRFHYHIATRLVG